jgi:hypothetical protein
MAIAETWTDPDSLDRAAGDVLTEVIWDGTISNEAWIGGQTSTGHIQDLRLGIPVHNATGGALAAGDLLYINGYNASSSMPTVAKADGDSVAAEWVGVAAIADGATGYVFRGYELGSQDTSGSSVGAAVYLSATAGGWTATALTGSAQISQRVGVVMTSHASTGTVQFNLSGGGQLLKVGSGQIQADSIGVSALADGTDGELITWNASGAAATVGVGTATNVLTSNGSGAAPTFQAAAGGGAVGAISKITSGDITTSSTSFVSTGFTIADTLSASSVHIVTFSFSDFMDTTGGETFYDVFDGTNYASSGGTSAYTNGILEVSSGNASDGFPVSVQSVWTGLSSGATTFTLYWRIGESHWQGGIEANTSGPVVSASIIEMA